MEYRLVCPRADNSVQQRAVSWVGLSVDESAVSRAGLLAVEWAVLSVAVSAVSRVALLVAGLAGDWVVHWVAVLAAL